MTRSDLIETLAKEKGLSLPVAEEIILTMFKYMTQTLIDGGRIEIRGFGVFEIREYEGYTARNPKTQIEVDVPPKKTPFFKAGKELKERILDSGK